MNALQSGKVGHHRAVPANFRLAFLIAATLMAGLLSAVPPTNAQTYRGAIRGVVRDPSGAAIVGANVAALAFRLAWKRRLISPFPSEPGAKVSP
jgi:hypothetical protein